MMFVILVACWSCWQITIPGMTQKVGNGLESATCDRFILCTIFTSCLVEALGKAMWLVCEMFVLGTDQSYASGPT